MKTRWKIKILLRALMLFLTLAMIYKIGRRGDRNFLSSDHSSYEKKNAGLNLVTTDFKVLPSVPFLVNWCEGNRCEERRSVTLVCDTNIYQQADASSPVVKRILSGTRLVDRTLVTKVVKLGSFRANSKEVGVVVSKTEDLNFNSNGSEMWTTFQDGRWEALEWANPSEAKAAELVGPVTEQWALVKTSDGLTGFIPILKDNQGKECPLGENVLSNQMLDDEE